MRHLVIPVVGLLVCAAPLAGQTATQTATLEVQSIKTIAITNTSPTLTVSTATAGSGPTAATSSTTYDITVNATETKITGGLNSNVPSNTTLSANLAAPSGSGASSAGATSLTTTAADLVTAVGPVAVSGTSLALSFSATIAAGVVASTTRTITYTLVTVTP